MNCFTGFVCFSVEAAGEVSAIQVKIKVKFTLEQATKAQKGSRGIAVLFNLGARWGGCSTPRPGRFTPGKDPVPFE